MEWIRGSAFKLYNHGFQYFTGIYPTLQVERSCKKTIYLVEQKIFQDSKAVSGKMDEPLRPLEG